MVSNDKTGYSEIAEQIYNLVDNDNDKINAFLSIYSEPEDDERKSLERWFDNYVKPEELNDLMKKGQNKRGLIKWLSDNVNDDYVDNYLAVKNGQADAPKTQSCDSSAAAKDIEDEDEEIYNGTSSNVMDISISSDKVDDEDEIDLAFKALKDNPDLDVTFELVNDSSEDDEDDGSEDSSVGDKSKKKEDKKSHKKKVHLNHTINKIVKKIDDEEVTDRLHHEKYYVAKRDQLGSPENLDKLEDELDKNLISYYDFPHVSIKMYESNEVKMNRIFKKLGFSFRCKDIAKYTKNWHAK